MTKKDQTKVQEITSNVLSLLAVEPDQFSLDFTEAGIQLSINLPEEDSGIFIGHRGETIASLQLLLSLIISQRLGDWHRLRLNVGDYQERRLQNLLAKAEASAQQALQTGQEIIIPNLNSYERQLVHTHLAEYPDISTESRGDGPYRQLFIVPKS